MSQRRVTSNETTNTTRSRQRMSSSIRHSHAEGFEFDPLSAAVQSRRQKEERQRLRRASETEHASPSSSLFEGTPAPQNNGEERQRAKEAGQLAAVFLEMRKGLMDSHNVAADLAAERQHLKQSGQLPQSERFRASRTTLQRAEKTKVMLNLKYFSLFQAQKPVHNPVIYKGVDGVYNPLQIIRNRHVRKRFHQPPQLSIKTLPAASEAFSKNKHKLIWQIDLQEQVYDVNWRTQHWHDLINPKGELWFPLPDDPDAHHHHHSRRVRSQGDEVDSEVTNMHDKLFQSEDESSKEDLLEVPRSRKRDKIANKLRRRSKSPFKRGSSLTELSTVEGEKAPEAPQLSTTQSFGILSDISIEPIHERKSSVVSGSENGASSSGLHTRNASVNASTNALPSSREVSGTPSTDIEREEQEMYDELVHKLNVTEALSMYDAHALNNKRTEYSLVICYEKLFQDFESTEELNEDLKRTVSMIEGSLKTKSKELQSVHNELSTEFSTRVDKLLLLTDRTIGEVNTTLALEARKLTERYEKLGPLHRRKDALVSFAYWLLENFVVLMLWIIWIGFSIGRAVKFCLMMLWTILKWIIR